MELYQLRYFQMVAECGTLREAAEKLAVSQSAVSRAIAMLESEIGVELFTRRGRANELNRFGKAFLRASLVTQRSLDTAIAGVRELAGVDAGTVTLGFLNTLGVAVVPRLIRRHHDRFPGARFELRQAGGTSLLGDLATGAIDLCLSYPMPVDEWPGVKWHRLFNQQLCAVVHRDHSLAKRKVIGFEELADQPFVVLNCDYAMRRIFDDACARHGITPKIAFEGTGVPTLRGLIGARLGVGVLPPSTTSQPDVVEIAIDDKELARPIAIGWMTNRYLPPSAAAFRDTTISSWELPEPNPTAWDEA
ncbi:LysR family transcriptional regulator [Mycobacterium shinjukuense]|uniref:Probable hydrogen peroxide-inducible genes activator n=1 Tax=Mycobacterium shinjukuense TaxID=398694 RepID=A0A7I7MVM0_9MYCO|nr:LysR family transcriptional regulator [Mycobacterium shinjukuense]MCV6984508.1 LysR family transcriptional regulator [Mycobacterium shinjukuense]ORB65928.1 LuxR family transcriptional regulator [Mycobacterium shinjukuense]BBX76195.1 LysR family transcriptional regulator [Mycobacterium shinjukuense]